MTVKNESDTMKLPLWENLVTAVLNWDYGTIHTHEEISTVLSIPYNTHMYSSAITSANAELTIHGKRLKSVRGYGYEVLKPENYLTEAVGHLKRSTNQLRKSATIAFGCKLELLTQEKRDEVIRYRDHMKSQLTESVSNTTEWLLIARNSDKIPMLPRR